MRVKSPARDTLEGLVAEELSARFRDKFKTPGSRSHRDVPLPLICEWMMHFRPNDRETKTEKSFSL